MNWDDSKLQPFYKCPDWERVENAVRNPLPGLMAIEVATRHEVDTLMAAFAAWSPDRPVTTLDFTPSTPPENLFIHARQTVEGWPQSLGLLALASTDGESTQEETDSFWSQMNQMRENWDSLQAQIILFLLPRQYRALSSRADHLKRWIPIKAHLLPPGEDWSDSTQPISDACPRLLSPQIARQTIKTLESQLVHALKSGTSQEILVSRFYLPLFTASLSLGDLGRTTSLLEKIRPYLETLTCEKQAPWWPLLFQHYVNSFQIEEALKTAIQHYDWSVNVNDFDEQAAASHQIGIAYACLRNFASAEQWYLKSLSISEKQGNEYNAANTYHQLGNIAEEQREFAAAEQWYLKSLSISEKQGYDHDAAITYHQLGRLYQDLRDLETAKRWYLKSLAIWENQENEHHAANTYHQLGNIAKEQSDFDASERWYLKSLAIKEKQGNEFGAASAFHQLGSVSQAKRDFGAAERWYLKSLAISEKQKNDDFISRTYHQLGRLAQEQHDLAAAERWYLKSLAILEKRADEHGAASAYHQLGRLAHTQADAKQAVLFYLQAYLLFQRNKDQHNAMLTLGNLAMLIRITPNNFLPPINKQLQDSLGPELAQKLVEAAQSPA